MVESVDVPAFVAHACGPLWRALHTDPATGIWVVDDQLSIVYAAPQAATMLGGTVPEAVVGRRVPELVPDVVADRMHQMFDRVYKHRSTFVGQAFWRGRRVRSTFTALEGSGGERLMLIVTRLAPLAMQAGEDDVDEADYAALGPLDCLTPRELEVLSYFGLGLSPQEIAAKLFRSIKTVKRFREGIADKLGVRDRCSLSRLARDAGLSPEHVALRRIQVPDVN